MAICNIREPSEGQYELTYVFYMYYIKKKKSVYFRVFTLDQYLLPVDEAINVRILVSI